MPSQFRKDWSKRAWIWSGNGIYAVTNSECYAFRMWWATKSATTAVAAPSLQRCQNMQCQYSRVYERVMIKRAHLCNQAKSDQVCELLKDAAGLDIMVQEAV
jgi:hypothetical protein